jgi:hypothetical protein
MQTGRRSAAALALCGTAWVFAGCGDDGPASLPSEPLLLRIVEEPAGVTLWAWNDGAPAVPAVAPAVRLNAALAFEFGGPVDAVPASDPFSGAAQAPTGTWAVEDDPLLPAGNRRRLVFRADFDPAAGTGGCVAGFASGAVYPLSFATGQVDVGGEPLANKAVAAFVGATCPSATGSAFADLVPGSPFIVATTPASSDPAPAPVAPSAIPGGLFLVTLNERVDPSTSPPNPLVVRDAVTGASLTGVSQLLPPTTGVEASAFSFVPSVAVPPGRTLEFVLAASLRDFGGNAVETSASNDPGQDGVYGTSDDGPKARRLFAIAGGPPATPAQFVENFDDATQLASVSSYVAIDGGGLAVFGDTLDAGGDGSDGAFVAAAGTTAMDTDGTIVVGGVPQSRRGVWNFTSLTVPAGATLRFHGPWPARIRVLGDVSISGVLNLSAGAINPALLGANPPYEAGPRTGAVNNGGVSGPAEASGGVGNAGGGAGGRSSHADVFNPPTEYCPPTVAAVHSYLGERGFGPSVLGVPNTDPLDGFFAGGGGGRSGFFPASFVGEQGGYGGAGGTGATLGGDGQPRVATNCSPTSTPVCPVGVGGDGLPLAIAAAAVVPPLFLAPFSVQTAGSGGGGGGDRLETNSPPMNDEQGGAGGGGGGSLRLSTLGALSFGAGSALVANGATGSSGAVLAGNGGSGSGGQLWLTALGGLTATAGVNLQVIGPARFGGTTTAGCSLQAAGGGGQGGVQIEGPLGTVPLTSANVSTGAVVQSLATGPAGVVAAEIRSGWIDTGVFAPSYAGATIVSTLGTVSGATLVVTFEGAHANDVGTPDVLTLKSSDGGGPITAANLSALNGYRFVRYVATASVPVAAGAAPPSSSALPSLDALTLDYLVP